MKRFWLNGIYNSAVLLLGGLHIKVLFYFVSKDTLNTFFYFQALVMFAGTIPLMAFELVFQNFLPKSTDLSRRRILGDALLMGTIIYTILGAIVWLYRPTSTPYIILLFIPILLSMIVSYSRAMGNIHLANGIYITSILLTIAGLFKFHPQEPIPIASIYSVAHAIPLIFALIYFRPIFTLRYSRDFLRYTRGSLFAVLTSPIMRYWDRILLERISPQDIAGFTLVRRIDRLMRQIISSFMIWAIPKLSRPEIRERTIRMLLPSYLFLSLALVIVEIWMGRWLLRVLAKTDYTAYYPILLIFAIALLVSSIYSFRMTVIRLSGRIEPFVIHNYLFALTFIVCSLLLLKFSTMGIAMAFLIATLSAALYVFYIK